MYKHILVATDGSALSLKAVKTASALAKTCMARVTALHVMPPFDPPMGSEGVAFRAANLIEEYEKQVSLRGKATTGRVLARMRRAKVQAQAVVESDDSPGDALVRLARLGECDLIVMASHSRSGIERILLGSVASEVVNGTKTAVLICH